MANTFTVTVYKTANTTTGFPASVTLPCTGFTGIPAFDVNTGLNRTNVGGVDCYSMILRSGEQYFVKETAAQLQTAAG